MKILLENLKKYIDLPEDLHEIRWLLEDLGLEVKRIEQTKNGTIITFEFLANRGDHHCYLGIAREISGRNGKQIRLPEMLDLSDYNKNNMPIKILIQSQDCLAYSLSMFEKINKTPTTAPSLAATDLFKPLIACDLPLDCFAVNITNLINLELGQPLHVFDANRIVGDIKVRGALPAEKALPLFMDAAIALPEGTLVIADDQKILAIAGVIGCQTAKVTEQTTKIFLESAIFDPVAIRKTSKILGITTSATTRFERGSDPAAVVTAVGRAAQLLQEEGWSLTAQSKILANTNITNRVITIFADKVAKFLGTDINTLSSNVIQNHLNMYGFKCQVNSLNDPQTPITVEVPSWRYWDVVCAADLYEEIAKSIGYNKLPTVLPNAAKGTLSSNIEEFKQKVAAILFGQGFFEVMTDGFYSSEHRKKFLDNDHNPLWNHVNILNSKDQVCLKNNGLFQAVELIKENLNFKITNIKAFEWTRIFWPDHNSVNGLCNEKHILWMIASGKQQTPNWLDQSYNIDPLYLKGILEEAFNLFNLKFDLKYVNKSTNISHSVANLLHPGRCAEIYLNDKLMGILGEVHPKVLMLNDIKQAKPVYMELYYLDLIHQIKEITNYKKVPELQPLIRDVTLKMPNKLRVGEIIACLYKFAPKYLESIKVTNLYKNKDLPENVFVTFTLIYQPDNNNLLSRNLINEITQTVLHKTIEQFKEYAIEQN